MKVSQALLLHMRENGGVLKPCQLDEWLGQMVKAGLLQIEHITVGDCSLPGYAITDKGQEHLRKAGL